MSARVNRTVQFAAGSLALLALWEIIGRSEIFGPTWPPLSLVAATLLDPANQALFAQAIQGTAWAAGWGMALGAGTALVLAALSHSMKALKEGIDRLAAIVHAIPHIGIAPVLIVSIGRSETPVAIAAVTAFFPAYAAASAAFAAVSSVHQDLFTVLGSGRLSRFRRLLVPEATPGLLNALRLAAPGAVLGAILGEWFGAPSGLGLVIVSSAQNFQIPQLWAAASLATLLAICVFAILSGVQSLARRRFT